MNASTTFSRTMWGLTTINADVVNAGSINTSSMTSSLFKTNLVQSLANGNNLTLEGLTTGQVYLKSNGNNCVVADNALVELKTGGTTRFSISDTIATISSLATFNTATKTITLNSKVYQVLGDTFISNCSYGYLAGSLLPTSGSITYGTTCIGQEAGRNIAGVSGAQGSYNTCVGYKAGRGITTGAQNTVIATESMQSATTASGNVVLGHQTGASLTSGSNNLFLGTGASFGAQTSVDSVSIGYYAGVLQSSLQGGLSRVISVGRESNQSVNGNDVIAIGWRSNYATYPSLLPAFTNSIVIGNSVNNTLSNQIRLGSTSQFLTTAKISVGKLTSPTTLLDVEGAADINGNLSVRGGNNLQIYNATNTNNMNLFMIGNDYYFNNLSATGTISFQVNSFTLWSITPSVISTNLTITTPTRPPLDNSTNVATTEYVDTAFTAFLNTSNAWTSSNSFNVNLPTSTLNPTVNSQLTTKLYVDNKVATTISGVALLAADNTFTGLTNVFNSTGGVSFGIIAPSCSIAPLGDAQLCNKLYVDVNAISPPTKLITWQEDFLTSAGVLPIGNWAYSGTGGAAQSFGTSSHPGIVELTNNKTIYNLTSIESWFPKQIKWIARSTTAINTFNWYAGTSQGVSNYTNSAFIGHTSGTTTFFASVNNTTFSNFTLVTWVTNNWYEMTLDFNDPSIKFTIKNLTTAGNPESITLTSVGFDFNRTNIWNFAQVSVAGTNTTDVDFTSLSYQADRT